MIDNDELIKELKLEIEEKNKAIDALHIELDNVINSKSWKLTKPLRNLSYSVRNIKKIFQKFHLVKADNDYHRFVSYDSYYQDDIDFSDFSTDIKAIAFYLPQFHTFKENDEWWGKGFTEWTNMKKAVPRYNNHYQPRVPHDDFGYYDLTDIDVLKRQIELAKKHGLYGFCFYYYWFSGKRLMEKPVDMLLEHPEIDFPFCLCWANENWTRTWDGQEKNVLIAQDYSNDDPIKFIRDIKKYVSDPRYIRVDGKPLIMIYNPSAIPNVSNTIRAWRKEAKEQGIGEIYVMTRNLILDNQKPIKECDAEFDFAPLQKGFESCVISGVKDSYIFDYNHTVEEMRNLYHHHKSDKPFYYTSTMGWDNSPRRKSGFTIFHHYTLKGFYEWNRAIIQKTRKSHPKEKRFMFVNAWNEWCEGTYLDPDQKFGYANINTLSKSLFDIPFNTLKVINRGESKLKKLDKKVLVQVHLFHLEVVYEIIEQLNNIPFDYDCYITTDTLAKKEVIEKEFSKKSNAKGVFVDVAKNRGRDVAPFLIQVSKVYENYDYVCHIHSKKSKTVAYGDDWRNYLYNNLFGTEENVRSIFELFEKNKSLGLIYPSVYPVIVDQTSFYGRNKDNCKKEFKRLGIPKNYINEELIFPAGTMFWAKMDAIKPLFEVGYEVYDFDKEAGQLDATTAHAIERIIYTLAKSRGYSYLNTYNNTFKFKVANKKRLVLFAHYDITGNICKDDLDYLQELKKYSKKIVFITNKEVISKNKNIDFVDEIIENNEGFDFGCWKKALKEIPIKKLKEYDEIIFANNSSILSNLSCDGLFKEISSNSIRALSYTSFEEPESTYLKSDFMIFPVDVLLKDDIYNFFKTCEICHSVIEKKEICNVGLTNLLNELSIDVEVYINESKYINPHLVKRPIDLKLPNLMLLLGSPLINKNSFEYVDETIKNEVVSFINQCKK